MSVIKKEDKQDDVINKFDKLNIGIPWKESDSVNLRKMYINDKKNFVQIAEALGRSDITIVEKMIEMKLVDSKDKIREYDQFENSDYNKLLKEYYKYQKDQKRKKNAIVKNMINNTNDNKKYNANILAKLDFIIEDQKETNMKIDMLLKQLCFTDKLSDKDNSNMIQKECNELKVIIYKKKEYYVINDTVYVKLPENKKGAIIGLYINGKVKLNY